jgi:hypothetical protein
MKGIFSRLSLLTKVMLSTSVAITVLFVLTGEIVLRHITQTMSQSLEEEVQSSLHSYVSLWKARTEMLSSVSLILAGMPDVRGAFGTGDEATIRDTAGELWSKISSLSGVFLVTDPNGRVLASLGGVTLPSLRRNLDLVRTAAANFPAQSSGFYVDGAELYHFAITPVYVQSAHRQDVLINVLVAGYRVDALVAQQLKAATNSEFLFLTPNDIIASTLNPRATAAMVADLARKGPGERVTDGVIEYAFGNPASGAGRASRRTHLHSAVVRRRPATHRFHADEHPAALAARHHLRIRAHLPAGAPHRAAGAAVGSRRRGGRAPELLDPGAGG